MDRFKLLVSAAAALALLAAPGCDKSGNGGKGKGKAPQGEEGNSKGGDQSHEGVPDKPGEGGGDKTAEGGTEVKLCDNHTTTTVPAGAKVDRALGQSIAADLMAKWKKKNPDVDWVEDERKSHQIRPAHDNSALVAEEGTQAPGHTYRRYSKQDVLLWKRATEKAATAGSKVFHNADELGSTIAVSCDMCHPDAANTHPETYPKYQTQLGRVALLRDMINWCLVHPVRAEAMDADDPRMRAMEAYIMAQRSGTEMAYGKH